MIFTDRCARRYRTICRTIQDVVTVASGDEKETDGSDQAKIAPRSSTTAWTTPPARRRYLEHRRHHPLRHRRHLRCGTSTPTPLTTPGPTRASPHGYRQPRCRCAEGRGVPRLHQATMPWGRRKHHFFATYREQQNFIASQERYPKWLRKQSNCSPPAGDMERLRMSLGLQPTPSIWRAPISACAPLRAISPPEGSRQAVGCATAGVAVHVTCNTMPRNDEVAACLPEWLEFLQAAGVDAAILADVGVLSCEKHPRREGPHLHPGQRLQLPGGRRLV